MTAMNKVVIVFSEGSWTEKSTIPVGTGSSPVGSMLLSGGKLWCATHASIKIINPHTLQVMSI